MRIFPREISDLLWEGRRHAALLMFLAGSIAVLEALGVVNLFLLGHAVLGQEPPIALGDLFVDGSFSGFSERATLILLGGAFIVIATLRYSLHVLYQYKGLKWSSKAAGDLHKRIMNRLMSAQLQLFSEHRQGEIIHGLFIAPTGAFVAVESFVALMSGTFLILAVGIALGLASPWLLLTAAALGLVFFVALVHPSRGRVKRFQQQRYNRQSLAAEMAADVINGIRDIRAVNAEGKWMSDFSNEVDRWERGRMLTVFNVALPGPTLQTALQVFFGGLVVVSALTLSPEGLVTQLPTLGVFAYGLLRIFPAMSALGSAWIRVSEAAPNLRAARGWTDVPVDTLAGGTIEATSFSEGIRFEGVSFSYDGDDRTLDGADFNIEAGKTTALVGESGAGKSTLIDLILKFQAPDRGKIWLDGQDLADVVRQSWLEQIGFVGQHVLLLAGTIRANLLAWQPDASEEEMRSSCGQAAILEFIDGLPDGLDTFVGNRGATLSMGQRQRLAIARALLRQPRFLILDEATSALDGESESKVLESIFNGPADRTTLIISHRLATVRNADRIIVIDHGRVVEQGTHTELMTNNGRYRQLFSTQGEDLEFAGRPDVAKTFTS